jgi:hypothetical protein
MSAEADIYPLQAPELADRIDGAIGEGSQFHQPYGYYAQGVGPETALLPEGWIDRVHRVQSTATNRALTTASICRTCSCRRPQLGATRTASSASPCSRIAT